MKKKIEVLAPAGSYESLVAAITAGADAVYVGGNKFGARAFANNLTQEQLLEAIDYVHLHGRHIYLTVNTLLKEEEITTQLYDYLEPLYLHGLDAVIVQDIGVVQFIKKYFKDLPIHASTQMTITNALGARFLESQGVERVVTARELQLHEIKEIVEETSLEVESFVHGALCYCYSGQCLYSSLIGGRSGNRGQCAQPCRLPYDISANSTNSSNQYVLSLKDICTLDVLPELIESGIFSLKIEGRMKQPEYVAAVTSVYRKYVDLYLANGKSGYQVLQSDKNMLLDLYNRGGFHSGYYHSYNGPEMISMKQSNHAGVAAVKVIHCKGRTLYGKAIIKLNKGDILAIPNQKNDYTLGQEYQPGEQLTLCLSPNTQIVKGVLINRTRNEQLLQSIKSNFINHKLQEKINGKLVLSTQRTTSFILSYQDITAQIEIPPAQEARNQPMTKERVEQQLRKTGMSDFQFDKLDIELEDSLFLPMQQLNDIRRCGIDELKRAVYSRYRRTTIEKKDRTTFDQHLAGQEYTLTDNFQIIAYVETLNQLTAVINSPGINRIYVDCNIIEESYHNKKMEEFIKSCHNCQQQIYYVMPYIFRTHTRNQFVKFWKDFINYHYDGMVIRNYESYQFLVDMKYQKPLILDHNVYTFNHYSKDFWEKRNIEHDTVPLELNFRELKALSLETSELIVYGYLPMMVSAQCVQKTILGCTHKSGITSIRDRVQKEFVIKNCCDYCYNVIYNSAPLLLLDQKQEIEQLHTRSIRLQFTLEDKQQTLQVLKAFNDTFKKGIPPDDLHMEFTRGHFKRGIK
ncbi:MAG: DUF3656 domain-containing protein [Lachnospiraceae bacterium]